MVDTVTVVGAGLAGCEAAWQLAQRGVKVRLHEMKPAQHSPAHHSDDFAELVCSNSLRSDELTNAAGLLKEELRRLDSLILTCADANRVEAGGALAVDREAFARAVTEKIKSHLNIGGGLWRGDRDPGGEGGYSVRSSDLGCAVRRDPPQGGRRVPALF